MPDTTKTPSDAIIVQRLQAMGGSWDDEAERWLVPRDREGELRRLLEDVGRPVEWIDKTAEAA